MNLNAPVYRPKLLAEKEPLQEVWYLKLNSVEGNQSLWLRFTLLISDNGFKRIAETWAVFSRRSPKRDVQKVAVKQTHDIRAFSYTEENGAIHLGDCVLSNDRTRGSIQSKGHSIEWDLKIFQANPVSFNLVPESLQRLGLVKNQAMTVGGDLRFTGTCVVNGERIEWNQAPGMQAHLSGPKNVHSWVWGHSNIFSDERGNPADFVFEGLSARARLAGPVPSPRLSTLSFLYKGQHYVFNSFWDSLRIQSRPSMTDWRFQADRGELSFRGRASAEHRDFAGMTYEDTNGSLLYCYNSKLSNLEVHVYRRGKLESAFYSNGSAALEIGSRQKNPYVPILI